MDFHLQQFVGTDFTTANTVKPAKPIAFNPASMMGSIAGRHPQLSVHAFLHVVKATNKLYQIIS